MSTDTHNKSQRYNQDLNESDAQSYQSNFESNIYYQNKNYICESENSDNNEGK